MNVKSIICLILIVLLSCFILGSCDKNNDKEKEVFTQKELQFGYALHDREDYLEFENFEHIQSSFEKTPQENATYYYVINTEAYSENTLSGYYEYSYILEKYDSIDDQEPFTIFVSDINISPVGMPQKVGCGRIKNGCGSRVMYYYTAYPTNGIQTPITVKHALLIDESDRIMLFYQNEKVIGKVQYSPELADDEYYEQLFTSCLRIICGTPSCVQNKDTIDYQEEITDFSNADALIVIDDYI